MTDMTERHGTLLDPLSVQLAAEILDDLEKVRMANGARFGALTGFTPAGLPWNAKTDEEKKGSRTLPDKDGEFRTAGLSPDHPDAVRFLSIFDALGKIEADAVKNLEKAMGAHPLGPWVKTQRGLGFKQAGRLLAAVGDPYWRPEIVKADEDGNEVSRTPAGPRTVSALWAYAGEHVIDGAAARRRKGVKSNWSMNAKTRAWLCAESCVKQLVKPCGIGADGRVHHLEPCDPPHPGDELCRCSPFRVTYDVRKAHTQANRTDWTDGHRHVDAMRITAKEILKRLWREARRLHLVMDPELVENLPPQFGA